MDEKKNGSMQALMRIPTYPSIGREQFLTKLKPKLFPRELEHIETAYRFSKYGHRTQFRDGKVVRYFEHPKAVALILIDELRITNWQTIVIALLHDVLEDSYLLTPYRVEYNFGKLVARGVKLLTKKPKRGYFRRLLRQATPQLILIKLCDFLHNLRTLGSCSPEKQRKQINEAREKYLPLADLLIKKLPAKRRWQGNYLKEKMNELCGIYEVLLKVEETKSAQKEGISNM